jgi:aspartyl-tRNA(Asn)/glutamyl-tRNA(Gln) amidotransferase subunit C
MSVTKEDVRKVARLSRIAVPEERLEQLAGELTGIMGWIEQLNEVDIEGVEPMTSVVAAALPMREDVVTDGGKFLRTRLSLTKVSSSYRKRLNRLFV